MKSVFNVTVNGLRSQVDFFKFSGGETQVKFSNPSTSKEYCDVEIVAYIRDGEFLPLALLVDSIRKQIKSPAINLSIPYLPYARQDRVMNSGESLAVKVFCDLINSLKLDSVTVCDCHSDVGLALLENCKNDSSLPIDLFDLSNKPNALVAPDAGALKKTFKYAQTLDINEVIRADKTRNVKTGDITGSMYFGDVKDKSLLIIDDICDGGRTFIELAKVLRQGGAKYIHLHVTHGIFSKGKEVLLEEIDKVTAKYDWSEF